MCGVDDKAIIDDVVSFIFLHKQ